MNISLFDQAKADPVHNQTFEGEAVRLSNELRPRPAKTFIDRITGERKDIPARRGLHPETCSFKDLTNWLADTRIKKSESLVSFVHRVLAWRFPDEYARNKKKIDSRYRLEMEMIESNSKKDITELGKAGFQNLVRYDGSLTNKMSRIDRTRNNKIRIIRK